MLEKFEEYKRKTQSGWRCINSNTLFGKYIIYMINIYRYVNCILHIFMMWCLTIRIHASQDI